MILPSFAPVRSLAGWRLVLTALAMAVMALAGTAARAAVPAEVTGTVAPLVRAVTPAVVNISTRTVREVVNPLLQDPFFRRFFDVPGHMPLERRETRAAGSGVIVDARNGYVLTNSHVVDGADRIDVVTKDNRTFRARLVGQDTATDVAVLKIDADTLSSLPLGDSDQVQVGDFVLAIGNPFGLGQTVTSGIISATGRSGLGIEGYEDFLQTDASINPGNSGGALVNFKGQLIGINTAILAPGGGNIGIGFAVPINMARQVMAQLIAHGKVVRGHIGVEVQTLTPDLAQALGGGPAEGAVVVDVEPGSPADRAGLRRGDVVVGIDGAAIHNASELRNRLGLLPVGGAVALSLSRDGERRTLTIRIAAGAERVRQPAQSQDDQDDDDDDEQDQ